MNNEELYFWAMSAMLVWTTAMSVGLIWLTDQINKARDSIHREGDRVTHLYAELSRVETKLDVKVEEAQEIPVY